MLSYQHQYHAGNFADIHKHLCLIGALSQLHQKEKPISVIDTHAGDGCYDLNAEAAQQTQEAAHGIQAVWPMLRQTLASNPTHLKADKLLLRYRDIIASNDQARDTEHQLMSYPGSPIIALALARPQDEWIGFELHPQAYTALSDHIRATPGQHQLHQRDAFEGLRALLPTTHPRTLVIIDPSYEVKSDYTKIPDILSEILSMKRQTICLLWYPILSTNRHEAMLQRLIKYTQTKQALLISEWRPDSTQTISSRPGMLGSGMAIINPPWQLASLLAHSATSLQAQSTFASMTYHQQEIT